MKFKARIWRAGEEWCGHAFEPRSGLRRAYFSAETWEEAMSEAKRVLTGLNVRDPYDPPLPQENPFCHPAHTGIKKGPGPFGKHVQGPGSWDGFYDRHEEGLA